MKRVLICDDSPVDRKVIAKSLEKHFEVLQAEGGDAALEIVKSSAVDLLLLDINMPGKDGPETLRELRNLGFQTPVVLLTAEVRTSVIKAMMVDGIKSYIVKPVSPDDLRKRVADVLDVSLDGAEEEEEPQPVEVSKQSAFAILVVDQFEMVSTRLKELLGDAVKVTYAKTSMVARQYMDERKFDLVLVDTELPNIDLAAFVDSLIKLNSNVPIVGIYMRDVPNAFSDAMRLKFSGHIYKPFHKAELEVLYDEFLFSRDVKVISLKGPTLTALTPIMPASIRAATCWALSSGPKTTAPRPYSDSLASLTASSASATVTMGARGPKVSAFMMSMSWVTPVRTVAGMKLPSRDSPPKTTFAPFAIASLSWATTRSFCSRMTIAPSAVPSAVGSPEG